ncbi:hypothetical protein O7606_21505 [Micromonospora sp. WMMD882]|uniref:hypothetical protein n=1 Tax=Micromonospora sp. WMMD882 TaxID=3015151 RepID=UPI00248AACAF|nr:hypothetical protein [Micromonospora sp. WMMD882]WBB78766.1 hypothetical protein O7606_21505 [Micromonospora sp. WMMD882]
MIRASSLAPEAVDTGDELPADVVPHVPVVGSGDDRDGLLDLLRARGLRFRDGARWQPAR